MTKQSFVSRDEIDILFAKPLIPAIESGHKTHTIRNGWRNYKPGLMNAGCHIDGWKRVIEVFSVTHTYAKYVAPCRYGYDDIDHFIESMQKYYPNFNLESKVTVVGFVLA